MRHSRGIHYAVLGVVSRNPGVHGYALKRQCERVLGDSWQLNFGEVYRILDRLADDGLIEQLVDESESTRKRYRITAKGERSLGEFILAPSTDAPRALRQELAVKLLFASAERLPEILRIVGQEREAYEQQLHRLDVQRRKLQRAPVDAFVSNLLIGGAELAVRAELSWLDDVSRKLQEHFATRAA